MAERFHGIVDMTADRQLFYADDMYVAAVYRKQYLVIYDSVTGGTGYLKQLMNEKNSLIDIFERALQKL